jgi:Holliday junction resolvase RusA-like endonuclease
MARAKKAYKAACAWELFQTPTPWVEPPNGRIPIAITIAPPDNRRRDRDNIQSSLKYALDELANHLGVDDYLFDPSYRFADPVKGGRITVEVAG